MAPIHDLLLQGGSPHRHAPRTRSEQVMSTKQVVERPAEQPSERDGEAARRQALIGASVLRALGQPAGLHRVQVRPLWAAYYRVNVFVGPDIFTATVAHSYFL